MAFRLNRSEWQISRCAVSQFLWVLQYKISSDQTELIDYEAVTIKYYVCVCVCVSISYLACKSHLSAPCYIPICGLSGYTIILHMTTTTPRYSIKSTEHKMCVLILSATFVWFLFQQRTGDTLYVHRSARTVPLFLSDFNETLTIFHKLSWNPQILNYMKMRPVGAELLRADRKTDRHG